MGMTIGRSDAAIGRVALKRTTGTTTSSTKRKTNTLPKRKRLPYNFKAMSSQVMQAKTPVNANKVASKARRKAAMLQRNLKSGEYDDEEIKNAIAHAKSIERIAKKRAKHLQQEEALRNKQKTDLSELSESEKMEEPMQDNSAGEMNEMDMEAMLRQSEEELRRMMQELEAAMKQAEAEMNAEQAARPQEQYTDIVMSDIDDADLERIKKKHRCDEQRQLMEADMKYLKAMFQKLERERQQAAATTGTTNNTESYANNACSVSLQLAGMNVPVQAAEAPAMAEGASMDVVV